MAAKKAKAAAKGPPSEPVKKAGKTPKAAANPVGRPEARVDEGQVLRLAEILCTHGEIAAVLGCSTKTLQRKFVHVIRKGHEAGRMSLRRAQFRAATVDMNSTMLIWLGKQHLAQVDKVQQEQSGGLRIEVVYADRAIGLADSASGPEGDP